MGTRHLYWILTGPSFAVKVAIPVARGWSYLALVPPGSDLEDESREAGL